MWQAKQWQMGDNEGETVGHGVLLRDKRQAAGVEGPRPAVSLCALSPWDVRRSRAFRHWLLH